MKLTKSAYNNLFGGFQMDHSINKRIILDRVKKKKKKEKAKTFLTHLNNDFLV